VTSSTSQSTFNAFNILPLLFGYQNVEQSDEAAAATAVRRYSSPRRMFSGDDGGDGPLQQSQCSYIILDCSFVTGCDVNAVAALIKMKVII